jgi:hypothetical protein
MLNTQLCIKVQIMVLSSTQHILNTKSEVDNGSLLMFTLESSLYFIYSFVLDAILIYTTMITTIAQCIFPERVLNIIDEFIDTFLNTVKRKIRYEILLLIIFLIIGFMDWCTYFISIKFDI